VPHHVFLGLLLSCYQYYQCLFMLCLISLNNCQRQYPQMTFYNLRSDWILSCLLINTMKNIKITALTSLLLLIPLLSASGQQAPDNRIEVDGKEVFLSGANMAWMSGQTQFLSQVLMTFSKQLNQMEEMYYDYGFTLTEPIHPNGAAMR